MAIHPEPMSINMWPSEGVGGLGVKTTVGLANGFKALSESDGEEDTDMDTDMEIEQPPGLPKKTTAHRPKQQRKLTGRQTTTTKTPTPTQVVNLSSLVKTQVVSLSSLVKVDAKMKVAAAAKSAP